MLYCKVLRKVLMLHFHKIMASQWQQSKLMLQADYFTKATLKSKQN